MNHTASPHLHRGAFCAFVAAAFLAVVGASAATTTTITGDSADREIRGDQTMQTVGETELAVGRRAGQKAAAVFVFVLPDLGGRPITDAHLEFTFVSGSLGAPSGQMNLYGLGWRDATAVQTGDFFTGAFGADPTDATPLQADFGITWPLRMAATVAGAYGTDENGDAALAAYLRNQIAAGAGPGDAVFLRFNGDTVQSSDQFWLLASADSATPPVLTLTIDGDVVNFAPSVDAGDDLSITLPASAQLHGTVSDDGWPDPPAAVTTTWSQAGGPGTVAFADASALETTADFSAAGLYTLRLTADDGDLTDEDTLVATVYPAFGAPTFVDGFDPGWDASHPAWFVATWMQNGTQMSRDRCQTDGQGMLVQTVLAGEPYCGGSMQSNDEFTYGRWLARLKPTGEYGVLNSMFTKDWDDKTTPTPWDDGTGFEVDIELLSHTFGPNCGQAHVAIHLGGQANFHVADVPLTFNPSDDFHIWGFDLYPDHVDWHVDGEIIHSWQAPEGIIVPDNYEMFFNSWTSTTWILGPPAADADYLIDWVAFTPLDMDAVTRLPGDANGDGAVDINDFVVLKNNFGAADATWEQGDFNGDQAVDIDDFVILKNNFGASSGA